MNKKIKKIETLTLEKLYTFQRWVNGVKKIVKATNLEEADKLFNSKDK